MIPLFDTLYDSHRGRVKAMEALRRNGASRGLGVKNRSGLKERT